MFNILSFDMEDWFDNNFIDISRDTLIKTVKRVDVGVKKIIEILHRRRIKSTFFVLGRVAEENPYLVKLLHDEGQEVATHGYTHKPISCQTPRQFEKDLLLSIQILKSITGHDILGFRAPGYSITKDTLWALDIIKGCGLRYDSSIYPVSLRLFTHGGVSDYPQGPFLIKDDLVEFPLATSNIWEFKFPVATTAYFRIFPYGLTKWAINRLNQAGITATLNFHSWEFDENQPKLNLPFVQYIKHYYNISRIEKRFRALLNDFRFISCEEELGIFLKGSVNQ